MWFNGLNNTQPNLKICRTYSWKKKSSQQTLIVVVNDLFRSKCLRRKGQNGSNMRTDCVEKQNVLSGKTDGSIAVALQCGVSYRVLVCILTIFRRLTADCPVGGYIT